VSDSQREDFPRSRAFAVKFFGLRAELALGVTSLLRFFAVIFFGCGNAALGIICGGGVL
jgi:hypothetical protein